MMIVVLHRISACVAPPCSVAKQLVHLRLCYNVFCVAVLAVFGCFCSVYGWLHSNRQRYGPAWIVTSHDYGQTFNVTASPTGFFPGRLAAPRFIQYGKDFAGAPDGYVYLYFPGTQIL